MEGGNELISYKEIGKLIARGIKKERETDRQTDKDRQRATEMETTDN